MKITDFVRLDIMSINPYLGVKKRIFFVVLAFALSFIVEFVAKTHIPFLAYMFFIMAMLMMGSFPFALEVKNNTNAFYITQNIPRKTVVYGRYLYGFFVSLFCVGISAAIDISVLALTGYTDGIKSEIFVAAVVLCCLEILNAYNFPFFFKFGYLKGGNFAAFAGIVPIIIIVGGGILIAVKNPDLFTKLPDMRIGTLLIILSITIIAVAVSVKLSIKLYQKREF
jgi:hypothetical protein